jgi:hypothetical protein
MKIITDFNQHLYETKMRKADFKSYHRLDLIPLSVKDFYMEDF